MSYLKKINYLLLILFLLNSCSYFNTESISAIQIKNQSKWSKADQSPSFTECESVDDVEQKKCFENSINDLISDFIYAANLYATESINDELILVLDIDKEGYFSINEIIDSSRIRTALPDLNSIIQAAIDDLPQVLPAVKTNVGIYVSSQLKVPIRVIASRLEE